MKKNDRNISKLEEKLGQKVISTNQLLELGITKYFINNYLKPFKVEIEYNAYEQNLYYKKPCLAIYKNKS